MPREREEAKISLAKIQEFYSLVSKKVLSPEVSKFIENELARCFLKGQIETLEHLKGSR